MKAGFKIDLHLFSRWGHGIECSPTFVLLDYSKIRSEYCSHLLNIKHFTSATSKQPCGQLNLMSAPTFVAIDATDTTSMLLLVWIRTPYAFLMHWHKCRAEFRCCLDVWSWGQRPDGLMSIGETIFLWLCDWDLKSKPSGAEGGGARVSCGFDSFSPRTTTLLRSLLQRGRHHTTWRLRYGDTYLWVLFSG